jgi:hypothetical protein
VTAQEEFVEIIAGELNACPDRSLVLTIPSLEDGWIHGLPLKPGSQMVRISDDLSWWFVEEFAPGSMPQVRRMFDAVPSFFMALARLGSEPSRIDWKFIHSFRRYLLRETFWPTAYEVATGATEGRAGKASALIKRLTTAEQWQARS